MVVDISLWPIMFTKAEPIEECRHCHSLDHESGDCIQEPTAESKGKEPAAKRHKMSDSKESKLDCLDYQTGRCRRGAQCRFHHQCVSGVEQTTLDIDAPASRSHFQKSRMSFSHEGKRGHY